MLSRPENYPERLTAERLISDRTRRLDLTESFLGRRNHPQVQFPIGCSPLLLLLLLLLSIGSKQDQEQEQEQEQEADLDLWLFCENNSRFGKFSALAVA